MDLMATILNAKHTINPSRNNSHPPQAIWNPAPDPKHMLRCHSKPFEVTSKKRLFADKREEAATVDANGAAGPWGESPIKGTPW